jgi:predicted Zn finger-like uncharacterized protein
MRTPCPLCGAVTELDHRAAGRTIRCAACGKSFIAPAALATKGQQHTLTAFPVAFLVILHFLTAGIFTIVHLGMMHERIPRLRRDDPSSTVSLGLCFVPVFNIYWLAWSCRRLCLRINEQRELHGLSPAAPEALAAPVCVLFAVGMVTSFFSMTALYIWGVIGSLTMPFFAGWVQAAVNELCAETAQADVPAAATI